MEFNRSVIDLIKERKSTRTYDGRALEEPDLKKLNTYLYELSNENEIKARFKIILNLGTSKDESKKLGTYGFIQGANSYVIGIMNKDVNDAVEFGYLFEKIVLFAADLGVQTCWLGGTFKKESFHEISDLNENEFISVISPVGYKKDKRSIIENTMRLAAGSDKRKPWSELFFDKDMQPLNEKDEVLKQALEMVRLGPSASNKQPWRIIKDEDMFHFFICRTKNYGVSGYDLQLNDIGIAKCHFELALRESGIKVNWQSLNQADTSEGWEYVTSWTK